MFDDFERSFVVVILAELLVEVAVVVVGGQIRKYDMMKQGKKTLCKLKQRPKR